MFESTLYILDTDQLRRIMKIQKSMGVLGVGVLVELTLEWKGKVIHALHGDVELEMVEVWVGWRT